MDRPDDPVTTERLKGLGQFIRTRRQALGLTQVQLAQRVGWSQERISAMENGRYGMPSVQALAQLATGLEVSLAEVITAAGFPLEDSSMMRASDSAPAVQALLMTLDQLIGIRSTSLQEALTEAAAILAEVMAVDKIDAFILEPESQTLVALGTSTTPMGIKQHELGLERVPLAHGSRETEVFQTGKPYLMGDVSHDPGILPGVSDGLGVASMMIVPLEVAGKREGVLAAASSRPRSFDQGDLAFLQTVARWVGMVAQQAELSEGVARDAIQTARGAAADELMAVLAHDLGNLLVPVHARLDRMRGMAEREGNETYLTQATQVIGAVRRIERLVHDLLDASQLEHGLFTLNMESVELAELAREAVALFGTPERPIEVRASEDVVVQGDPDRLRQVFENLVGNAVRHSPEGLPVVIEVGSERREDGPWATVRVSDQGPGVPPEVLPTLFQRFSRGPSSSGLGVGLYLARGIAEAHGGTLVVDSSVSIGTVLQLTLPMKSAH